MTRLPQLEQELVAAAARLQSPRRMVAPAVRWALAAGAVALAVAAAAIVIAGGGGEANRDAAGPAAFPADAQLEDMMGVFRTPATEADRVTYAPGDPRLHADLQPGEDHSQSRRVDWPGADIFVWPMRDGVCWGVPSGSGCVPLDHLRRTGITVSVQNGRQGPAIWGAVVDGIDEVVLTRPGDSEVRVPVRENFFFIPVEGPRGESLRWTYAGEEHTLDVQPVVDAVAPPTPDAPDGAPSPDFESVAESASPPLEFSVGGTEFRAVGFLTSRFAVCVKLTDLDAGMPSGAGCLAGRGLRDQLAEKPAHLFAAGGVLGGGMVHKGYARADVIEITPRDESSGVTVFLSEPWRPEPWEGEPIRFILAFDLESGEPEPGQFPRVELNARLADGTVLPVR